ncbi:unnamed protein product [Caretta caretta]
MEGFSQFRSIPIPECSIYNSTITLKFPHEPNTDAPITRISSAGPEIKTSHHRRDMVESYGQQREMIHFIKRSDRDRKDA